MDKGGLEDIISGLENRTFLVSNANGSNAEIFQTRWALNYLRGPITKPQIEILMKDKKSEISESSNSGKTENKNISSVQGNKPTLPQDMKEVFFQPQKYNSNGGKLIYKPFIYGEGKVHYVKSPDIDNIRFSNGPALSIMFSTSITFILKIGFSAFSCKKN